MFEGELVSIFVSAKAGMPMESRESARAVPGSGLEGDRYFDGVGYWSNHPGEGREITLIEIEAIEALAREKNIEIPPELARRNLVTRGFHSIIWLGGNSGGFRAADGKRLCEPCQYLEALTTKGVLTGLLHRGGLRADIVLGGTIRIGDAVSESEK
jgi:MOSC domain-containing protein YiiM